MLGIHEHPKIRDKIIATWLLAAYSQSYLFSHRSSFFARRNGSYHY